MIFIRPALISDLSFLAEVERSASKKFAAYLNIDIEESETLSLNILIHAQKEGTLWVAEIDKEPTGFLAAYDADTNLHIEELSVAYDHQGRGLGRLPIKAAQDYARSKNYRGLSLTTDRVIPWNAAFYSRLGFQEIEFAECPPVLKVILARDIAKSHHPENRIAMVLDFEK